MVPKGDLTSDPAPCDRTYGELSGGAVQPVGQKVELFDFPQLLLSLLTMETLLQPGVALQVHNHMQLSGSVVECPL